MKYRSDVHHRRSIRLPTYDYRLPGVYFVTICTWQRDCILEDPRFRQIVEDTWLAIPDHFPQSATDEFIVMPNHFHGLLKITNDQALQGVGAHHDAPLRLNSPRRPVLLPGSLGAIVLQFKSAAAKRINELRDSPGAPVWQRNYYERIVRDKEELVRIREYILDNPRK